ncbi:hypothetical protein DL98DRAFT_637505 [Cadophora sp. DSE1049]|nr:hypothetical protein DL98DRAFT_637505 [Cadophora sp. DSE1049]
MSSTKAPVTVLPLPKKLTQAEEKSLLRAELEARVAVPEEEKGAAEKENKKPVPDKGKGTAEKDDKKPVPPAIKQPWVADLKKCPLLDLPDDKLKEILGHMLLRSDGVVPGPTRYDLTHIEPAAKVTLKSYQWECKRQVGYDEEQLPHYDGTPEVVKLTWSTVATAEDLALITNGVAKSASFIGRWIFPDTVDEKTGRTINHFLHQRGSHPAKVIHQCLKETTGIHGTALLRTCKRLREMDPKSCQAPFTNSLGVHSYHSLRSNRHLIPGLPYPDGSCPSYAKTRFVTKHMFTGNLEGHEFLRRDPAKDLFHHIGPFNAANIKSIKIEGFLKTVQAGQDPCDCPVGLLDLLPIYTAILKHCCYKLETLTIFMVPGAESLNVTQNGTSNMTDEQHIDDAISKVINGLPCLKVLELKAPARKCLGKKKSGGKIQDPAYPWGSALRWENFIADRSAKQAKVAKAAAEKKKAREEAEKKVADAKQKAEEEFKVKVQAWKCGKVVVYEAKTGDKVPAGSENTGGGVGGAAVGAKGVKEVQVENAAPLTFRKGNKGNKGKPGSRAAKVKVEVDPSSE